MAGVASISSRTANFQRPQSIDILSPLRYGCFVVAHSTTVEREDKRVASALLENVEITVPLNTVVLCMTSPYSVKEAWKEGLDLTLFWHESLGGGVALSCN